MHRMVFVEGKEMEGKPWTVEKERRLKELVEAESSLPVIAEKLRKPEEAVRQRLGALIRSS